MNVRPLNTEYFSIEIINGQMMRAKRKVVEHVKTERFKNDPEPRLIEKTVILETEEYAV